MAWLFETAGMKAYTLEGGYKAYRRYIREQFSRPVKMRVLGGFTGSGKTDILKILEKQGEQFLDIEGLAHHKGSVFGPLGQEPQPTNEQFENNLADAWRKFDFTRTLWMEDESRQLGSCILPDPLFSRLRKAPLIKILVPKSEREKRLVMEYGGFKKEELGEQLTKIRERLGGQYLKEALKALDNGDLQIVAGLTLRYYDKAYAHGVSQRPQENVFELRAEKDNPEENVRKILEFVESNLTLVT
jgi:tRNA 2-selenouridine synthase